MDDLRDDPETSVPPETYTREYYESHCQGHEVFEASQGRTLPKRLSLPLRMSDLAPGMRILDVGCGRGELLLHTRQLGILSYGLDYAKNAVLIARDTLRSAAACHDVLRLQQANARRLPYASNTFERVFLLDIVEHLHPEELRETFGEIHRVLTRGGKAIVHTMPNLWYYRIGYPVYRLVQYLGGHRLPANPRERWAYHEVHVNEQTPLSLRRSLLDAGFSVSIRLIPAQTYNQESNWLIRTGMILLSHLHPFRWVFCNDIFAIATKSLSSRSRIQ